MIVNNYCLEGLVLAIVSEEENGIYAYRIAGILCDKLNISESTIYSICNRLVKKELLSSEIMSHVINGRLRKHYKITTKGIEVLNKCKHAYQTEKNVLDKWLGK